MGGLGAGEQVYQVYIDLIGEKVYKIINGHLGLVSVRFSPLQRSVGSLGAGEQVYQGHAESVQGGLGSLVKPAVCVSRIPKCIIIQALLLSSSCIII